MENEHEIIGAFFEQMSSAAYIKDEDLKFIYVNPVFADFYGMDRERFIGKTSFQITNTVATKLLEQDEAKALSESKSTRTDDRATSFHGKTIWREVERRPIILASGERYLAVVMRDITEHKAIEFKLQDKERELGETRELAETAENRSAEFFAKISHQVRTPLQTMISVAKSVTDENYQDDRKAFSDVIVSSGKAAIAVLDDISSHSMRDISKTPVKAETFELFKMICDITAVVTLDARKKALKFSSYIDPDIPMHLQGDAGKIRQVLINLIGNAIKFTQEGEVKLDIRVVPGDNRKSTQIRFEISDTGEGISANEQKDLFAKYRPVAGNGPTGGLGLSISSSLVNLLGGEIGVDSRLGLGSKFWFEIGFIVPKRAPKPQVKNPNLKGKRFIVIDKSLNDLDLMETQLKNWGGDVAACKSSDEAIAVMCATFENNLSLEGVFIDEKTNSDNEYDLVTLMKEDDTLRNIPLFMIVSGNGTKSVRKSLADSHVIKPLDAAALGAVLRNELNDEEDNGTEDAPAALTVQNDAIAMEGLQHMLSSQSDVSKADILILEGNSVNQIMLAQILETTGYTFKITSKLSEVEQLFKSCHPKIVLVDATSREFNNEDTRLGLEKLKRYNSLVPLLGMVAPQNEDDQDEDESVLLPVIDGQILKPISPPELFNKIEKWMGIAEASQIRRA